jgi:hypothetical protein
MGHLKRQNPNAMMRHQLDLVPQRDQLPRPEVARGAGLQVNQAGLKLAEERYHLTSPQRFGDNNFSGRINSMDLKNVLGQIKADGANLHGGWLLLLVVFDDKPHFGTSRCREREPSTPSAFDTVDGPNPTASRRAFP